MKHMNSLDAIIALLALLACYGAMLGIISAQSENTHDASETLKAKNISANCAAIIDSIYSNTAESYAKEFACEAEQNFVSANKGDKEKKMPIITTATKKFSLEVKTLEHYT